MTAALGERGPLARALPAAARTEREGGFGTHVRGRGAVGRWNCDGGWNCAGVSRPRQRGAGPGWPAGSSAMSQSLTHPLPHPVPELARSEHLDVRHPGENPARQKPELK